MNQNISIFHKIDQILQSVDNGRGTVNFKHLFIFFILTIVFFSVISPNHFLTISTLQSIAMQLPVFGILTLAMGLAILTGGINLSIIATSNISSLFSVWAFSKYLTPAMTNGSDMLLIVIIIVLSIIIGGIIGIITGYLVAYLQIHSILVTLSVMLTLQGIGTALSSGKALSGVPVIIRNLSNYTVLGLPIALFIFLAICILLSLLLKHTPFGTYVYMIGSNQLATNYSGVNTRKVLIQVYMLSSVLSVIAGILMMGKFNSARIGYGDNYLLPTILACILGGLNPYGGFGKIVGIFIALLTLQIIASGLNMLGANQYLSLAIWGTILFVVVSVGKLLKYKKK